MVPVDDRAPPLRLKLFGAFSLLCLAAIVPVLLLPTGRLTGDLVTLLDDPALVFAATALLFARSRSTGRMRRIWGLFALGVACWVAGELVYEVRAASGAGSETSVADVFYLLFYPPVMVGLFLLGREGLRQRTLVQALDLLIVMAGTGLLFWVLVRQTALSAAGSTTMQVVDIGYVALGLGLLWMLFLPVIHVEARWTRTRTLMACSFVGIVAADAIWAVTPTDAYGLIAGSSLVLLGISAARDPDPTATEPQSRISRRRHLLAEFAVVGVAAVAAILLTSLMILTGTDIDLVLGRSVLLVLVFARLLVSISINDQLLRASDRRASTDPLTGLLNHGAFHEHLAREISRARRSETSVALLYLDLDHLKAINDLGGHRAGDAVLTEIAEMLRATCRDTDLVCRVGGDEMAIIAPATGLQQARELADRLNRAAHAIWAGPPHARMQVSLSLGLSVFPALATTKARLMAQSDAALYVAKERGRDGWMTFDPRSQFEDIPEEDISRARAELAGRASDFRAVFTHALEPMIITDHVPVILEANDAAVQLAGVSRERLIGHGLVEFVDSRQAALLPRILASIEVSSRQGGTIPVAFPSGRRALIEFEASRFSPDRTLVGLRDITQRTEALAELTRSEARFRGLFDGAPEAMFITDDAGVVIDANPAAAELTGRVHADLVGTPVAELGPEEDRELIEQTGQDLLREHTLTATYGAVDAAGCRRIVEYSSVADIVPGEHLSIVREVTGRVHGTQHQGTLSSGAE